MFNKIIVAALILIIAGQEVFGQRGNCSQNLLNAEKAFEEGVLRRIPQLVLNCTRDKSFDKPDQIRALKLLTIAYLFMDNEQGADESMVRLLKMSPELKIDPANDPDEFIFLHSRYKTDPIFRFGGYIGVNNSAVNVINNYGVYNFNTTEQVDYDGKYNLALGLTLDFLITSNLEISAEFGYSTKSYTISGETNYLGRYNIELEELQVWMDIPLMLKYNFFVKKTVVPYVYAGAGLNYLLNAKLGGDRTGDQTVTVNRIDIVNNGNLRNQINQSVLVGFGAKMKSNTDYFTFDVRYSLGLTNYVNAENRFNNQELGLNVGYIDNDVSMNYFQITLGYARSVFNPKKLKKYRR